MVLILANFASQSSQKFPLQYEIKPSRISPSPKLQKYLHMKYTPYTVFVESSYQSRFCLQISYPAILFTMLMRFLNCGSSIFHILLPGTSKSVHIVSFPAGACVHVFLPGIQRCSNYLIQSIKSNLFLHPSWSFIHQVTGNFWAKKNCWLDFICHTDKFGDLQQNDIWSHRSKVYSQLQHIKIWEEIDWKYAQNLYVHGQ